MLCQVPYGDTDGSVFLLTHDGKRLFVTLSEHAGTTLESRTEAVATVTEKLRETGFVTGWRDELFPAADTFYNDPMFLIERSAINVLGLLEYGVHINGLVQESTLDEPKMWIGRRSATKSKFPGMLDHLVAGGQPAGLTLMENVIKECEEEAGVPEDLVRAGAHAVGAISYESWEPKTDKVSRVVLFNYDLYLPPSFVPKPVDGEVEEFFLWTIDQVKDSTRPDFHDPIKPNCYVVIIDYLLRKGYISPQVDGYLDILKELRSGDCQ
jgi:8-oxo-dGTP pyrophosphatase MutT (NUDIX family)